MDRGAAVCDLPTAGEQFEEPEDSSSMNMPTSPTSRASVVRIQTLPLRSLSLRASAGRGRAGRPT
eukprot:1525518-Alexandrium_andersonii.AAC.1